MRLDLSESYATSGSTVRPPGVLVVDDVESVRKVLAAGLGKYGFTVWLAGNGREALDLYRLHFDSIGIVLLDVMMPGRDGLQTLADLRLFNPHVLACFLTGWSGLYSEAVLLERGAAAVFRKPVQIGELAERLLELMTRPVDAYMDLQSGRWEYQSAGTELPAEKTPRSPAN